MNIKLDFLGKKIYTVTRHKRSSSSQEIKTTERYKYTNQDRLLTHTHQIGDSGQEQLLSYNGYDPLGKLISKKVGGTDTSGNSYLQKVDYSYNIRGWLTGINSIDNFATADGGTDLFALSISYNDISNSPDLTLKALYNGNISQTSWISRSDSRERSYTYQYDALSRLNGASYFKSGSHTKSYDEWMDYDKNGNILHLKRNGDLDYDSFTIQIDDLDYSYKGNQIRSVKDASGHPAGFRDGADMADEYKYDGNGNMISDENKGIASISYNHMNLPIEIIFKTGGKINYLYNASGNKLKKTVAFGSKSTATDYLSGFQYVSGKLDFFQTAEGYVKWVEDSHYNYIFNYTDHLGNVRMSYGMDPKEGKLIILEENHYYPFGMKHEKYNSDQYEYVLDIRGGTYPVGISPLGATDRKTYQYKYNGKEWQDESGLNMTAMDFRQYDNMLGRFWNIDLLSELAYDTTPYRFAFNNPNYWSDPTGMFEVDDKGNLLITDPKEIAMFYNYLSKNPEASLNDMWEFVTNAENGFVLQLAEVVIEGVVTSSIKNDGISVYGVGKETLAHAGDGTERGSKGVDAETGDMGMLMDFGYKIVSPPLISMLVFIDIFTPSTFFAGENAQYVGKPKEKPQPKPVETVSVPLYRYSSTDAIRGNTSRVHRSYKNDTIVVKGQEATIRKMQVRDSILKAVESDIKNVEYKKNGGGGYYGY
jgi:RHS repeat-associated protein